MYAVSTQYLHSIYTVSTQYLVSTGPALTAAGLVVSCADHQLSSLLVTTDQLGVKPGLLASWCQL